MKILTRKGITSSSRPSSRTIAITVIGIVTAVSMLAAPGLTPVSATVPSTSRAHESIIGNGIGDLVCTKGNSYPNTQINFNAIVLVETIGSATGSLTLTATAVSGQIQGTVTSGGWDPSTGIYSISGTTISDNVCGISGTTFNVSGHDGDSVPISMAGGYDFNGTGAVTTVNAHAS